jgi:putative tricarboxylic transport membrane protein
MSETDERPGTGPDRVSLVHPRRSPVAAPFPMIAQATLDRDTGESLPTHAEYDRQTALATVALGGLMVVAGIVVLVDAASLRETNAAIGPAAVPTAVGILLGIVGLLMATRAWWTLRRAAPGPGSDPALPNRAQVIRLGAMVGVLIAYAVLLPVLGYVVCAALLFTGAAVLLGAPRPLAVFAYGWTLAIVVFLVFDRLIGLALPVGPWGF